MLSSITMAGEGLLCSLQLARLTVPFLSAFLQSAVRSWLACGRPSRDPEICKLPIPCRRTRPALILLPLAALPAMLS